jgi:hypothetical protein
METNPVHRAEPAAINSTGRGSASPSFPATTLSWLAACLLILLGAAFELGMLGFGPYNSSGVLLLLVVGKNAWTMLADLAFPELREMVKTWPLTLVILGASIMLIAQRRRQFEPSAASSGRKENHAN